MTAELEKTTEEQEHVESHSRRNILKKAAYIAPALITIGVLSPLDSAHAFSVPPPVPGEAEEE